MSHLEELEKLVGKNAITIDKAAMEAANKPKRYGQANSDYLALVTIDLATEKGESKLRRLLRYCNYHNVKIVPRSGGTALTKGSSIDHSRPEGDYILLKIFSPENIREPEIMEGGKLVRIFPGNTTKELNPLLNELGYVFPVDLGIGDVKGEAQMLGYLATDAAGTGAAFKGRARDIVEYIRVMMPDGNIYDLPSRINSAPKLEDVIGMGGTTGIILEAVIRTVALPKEKQVAVVSIDKISEMYGLIEYFKQHSWENLNLFERLNQELFEEVVQFTGRGDAADTARLKQISRGDLLFIELTSGVEGVNLKGILADAFTVCGLNGQAVIADDEAHGNYLLGYRVVNASVACDEYAKKTGGETVAFDISVPVGDCQEFPTEGLIAELREEIPGIKIFSFGHAAGVVKISPETGKGGTAIHFNPVVPAGTNAEKVEWLRKKVFYEVAYRGGKIVSEHTPGTKLTHYMETYNPADYAKDVAKVAKWNPNCTLNAGAYVNPDDVAKLVEAGRGR